MNNISIVGRISRDLNVVTTSNGVKMLRFAVAVKSDQRDENGEKMVDFFSCLAWREKAETIAKFFKKGSAIGIVGSMNSHRYKNEKENTSFPVWEITVKDFSFVGFTEADGPKPKKKSDKDELTPVEDDDDLPF